MLDREQAARMRRLLWQWGDTPNYVRRKELEYAQYRAVINDVYDTLGAQNLDGMPRSTGVHSSVERAVEASHQRVESYRQCMEIVHGEILRAMALKAAIDGVVDDLDATARAVLQLRYIDRHQWSYIGLKLNYDERQVQRVERETLEKMSRNVGFDVV